MTSTSSRSSSTITATRLSNQPPLQPPPPNPSRRFPVTPAVLRSIFTSSRTPHEERSISRVAFFRFTGFLLSCVCISFAAARGRGMRGSAGLLGVV
ncbi:uncharacterized protein EDB93DRAFT_125280 [Suillus bovinus]|uniref:uncharacterized protein n=1 Tax=Suillus bovinus TaxID=48563 RepID=UPI001B871ADD|nr:uncharacterized protein EDB93DRAFT_125280 [Suillus bovinus]KAG2154945.1 hypothetical protein EDB93DRAFT_125280 [Suillus bovinus]